MVTFILTPVKKSGLSNVYAKKYCQPQWPQPLQPAQLEPEHPLEIEELPVIPK